MRFRHLVATLLVASLAGVTGCDAGSADGAGADADAGTSPFTGESAYPTYVALGDSYTAAPGVPQTDLTTGCARSDGNYPALLASALDSELVDVSCSGATTRDLAGPQRSGERVIPPQLDALTPETSLVTLGIGGNDVRFFQTLVGTCARLGFSQPEGTPCRDLMTSGQEDVLVQKIDTIRDRVTEALEAVHERSPDATVVLVGYPQPVPAHGTCAILPLAAGDYGYVRTISARLNDALRAAAEAGDAAFIDMVRASRGHDICAGPDAWVNGMNTDLARAVAFHPFAAEQQAVADLLEHELS
jgi:lysophospholipase L1-like esterase